MQVGQYGDYLTLVSQGLNVSVVIEHVLLSKTCQLANIVHQETCQSKQIKIGTIEVLN